MPNQSTDSQSTQTLTDVLARLILAKIEREERDRITAAIEKRQALIAANYEGGNA